MKRGDTIEYSEGCLKGIGVVRRAYADGGVLIELGRCKAAYLDRAGRWNIPEHTKVCKYFAKQFIKLIETNYQIY